MSDGSEFYLDLWASAGSLVDVPAGCCYIKIQAAQPWMGKQEIAEILLRTELSQTFVLA